MKHTAHPRRSLVPAACLVVPALAALAGCGSDAMSLGSNEVVGAVQPSTCPVVSGDVEAESQWELDALRGCEELPGSLRITTSGYAPGSLSLEPLSQLRHVRGTLDLRGPFTSLAGLESLEAVGLLYLHDTSLTDLTALQSLTRIETPTDWRFASIMIDNCDLLSDLTGLESISSWDSLEIINSDGLVSLSGLYAPERVASIIISDSPQLRDLRALASVIDIGLFNLSNTGITDFAGFSLYAADTLNLAANAALTDLDGLDQLSEVSTLSITDNDALVRMDLPNLVMWDTILVSRNDVLEAVNDPNPGAGWAGVVSPIEDVPYGFLRRMFAVSDNPRVASISMPDSLNIERIFIAQNPSLGGVDMPAITRADTLWIEDNAALSSVQISELDQVATLTIRNNPALSVAPFAEVQTLSSDVTGNLDALQPAP